MKVTAFVSSEDCPRHDTGWSHPDHQGRLPAIVRAVQRELPTLWEPLLQREAVPATVDDLLLVHTPEHLHRLRATVAAAAEAGRTLALDGVPVSGASWDAVRGAAGAALTACEAVLLSETRNAFALTRPPGRDASPDAAGGFSLANTVAIAARHLLRRHGVRPLVVGWGADPAPALADLIAADGLSYLALDRTTVGDAGFAATLERALAGVSGPAEFVLLSAGFDILAGDPVGDLGVRPGDVHALTTTLRAWCDQHAGGRLVSILDGGYDAGATALAVVQHLRALASLPPA